MHCGHCSTVGQCGALSGRVGHCATVGLTVIRDRNGVTSAWCVQPVWTRCQREPSLFFESAAFTTQL